MKKRKILVVDDEPDIVATLMVALELAGYQVCTAGTGTEAVAQVKAQAPDLLIIDMVLPEMDGCAVARWMRTTPRYRHIPVILITALAQQSDKEAFSRDGIECVLVKPFDLNRLEQTVQEILEGPCRNK